MQEVRLIVKFGTKDHLLQLHRKGLFYCKHIKYFTDLEDNNVRGDKMEAVIKLRYFENPNMQIREANDPTKPWLKLNVINASYQESTSQPLGNLFCMSAFKITATNQVKSFEIPKKCCEFGDHFLLINNQNIFFERLEKALNSLPYNWCKKYVSYLELKKYTGTKTIFQKDLEYAWQEEFRIYIDSRKSEPYAFSIGNLEDISTLYEVEKVKDLQYKLADFAE